ncbi:patatin-like phospholipase family protein [Leptospira sp. GIMC2001]|uniref:patatin-like phospholipase family protein n=1 Tax=Leptospira sp. GIMC2001 TaxID=1513297 RepID=UPI00234A16A7|nr:patatin-like phospholipase family protein [Leptospira sp. GIMC2001]WCL51285.1 patatin-like phospholipase family protein [Leptospira sp. GIMC2001]
MLKFLKSVELFKGLSLPALKSILRHIEERMVRNHDFLYYKGEASEHIYIIRYGEIVLEGFSGKNNIYLGPGDVISENSLLSGNAHSTSAYAVIDSLVYMIDGKAFMQIALKERALSQNIMKLLSSRMREHIELQPLKKYQPRRLFCHLPLDGMDDFQEKLNGLIAETSQIQTSSSVLIKISQFKGLSHEKFSEELSAIRKKSPLVHLYFDTPETCMDLPSIVLQSDLIIFWEKETDKNINEKENILNFWKTRIRNFNGRTVLYKIDSAVADIDSLRMHLGPDSFHKAFTKQDALARFLVSRTRGIALGGGGARSLAHIGLFKILHREGLHFDFVSGASFGAVVGALYARGDSLDSMELMIRKFFGGLESAFDPTLPFVSFFKGKKMRRMLKEAFGDLRIEELPIPFVTSAVDLQSGKEYVFDRGPVVEALIATMSLPGAFPPYFLGEKVLVDGGMVNNVPEDLVRAKGADIVLGVNVSPLQEAVSLKLFESRKASGKSLFRYVWDTIKYPPILKIMGRTITLEGREITRLKQLRMDLFLNFHLEEFQLFDFVRFSELIKKGESEANLYLEEIRKTLLPNKKF